METTINKADKTVFKQFSVYFLVALVGLFFDFTSLILLREILGLYYLVAAACGFCIGLIVVYILSNKFVFSSPKISSTKLQFLLFALIGIIGLGILSILMWLFTEVTGLNYILSKIIATVFVYFWNFFARKSMYNA